MLCSAFTSFIVIDGTKGIIARCTEKTNLKFKKLLMRHRLLCGHTTQFKPPQPLDLINFLNLLKFS